MRAAFETPPADILAETYRQDIDALKLFARSPKDALLRITSDGAFVVHRRYRRSTDIDRDEAFREIAAGFNGPDRARDFFAGRFSELELTLAVDWLRLRFGGRSAS